jgi:hypothetical protein
MTVIIAILTIFVSFKVNKTKTLHTALGMKVRMFRVFQNTKLDERKHKCFAKTVNYLSTIRSQLNVMAWQQSRRDVTSTLFSHLLAGFRQLLHHGRGHCRELSR